MRPHSLIMLLGCLWLAAVATNAKGADPAMNTTADDGSVHVMGNGRLCVYGQGADLIQVFGPEYSNPSVMEVRVKGPARSKRQPGTAIWTHALDEGALTDFVDSREPILVRRMELERPLELELKFAPRCEVVENTVRFAPGAALGLNACLPAGESIFHTYVTTTPHYYQILLRGRVEEARATTAGTWRVRLAPGRAVLTVAAGPAYSDSITRAERVAAEDPEARRARTAADWRAFSDPLAERTRALIEAAGPEALGDISPARLVEIADAVAVQIKAQQGTDGGVLAGHFYHLGYIRDQYGVMRGLLKLGCTEEARAITLRLLKVWRELGHINNAHGIDVGGISHVHECDDVEITGYIILESFDYFAKTGDAAFLREVWPMLEWAFEAQSRHLAGGMLPFNGDETYVAGAILPRSCLNDGSAEATMLFILGGEKMANWAAREGLWDAGRLARARRLIGEAREKFVANFLVDGRLATNAPERTTQAELPRFRHGVCEASGRITWTERNANGRYVSPAELVKSPPLSAAPPKRHFIRSVGLLPLYYGTDLVPRDFLEREVREIATEFLTSGRLPSVPDGKKTVGYDYGLLLYAMARTGHPDAAKVLERVIAQLDRTDAWVEYYVEGKPLGCRCRPWESAINLEAILEYLAQKGAARASAAGKP